MKELNTVQIAEVSGAGIYGDAGEIVGRGIGMIVDAAKGNTNHAAADAGATLGRGIGTIADAIIHGDKDSNIPDKKPALVTL